MININEIEITLQQVAKSDSVFITDVRPIKEFVDKKATDKVIGYSYAVVCPNNKFKAFTLKIEQTQPSITQEEIEAKGGTVKAKMKGFVGKFYQNKDKIVQFTAKATSIEVIP